MGASAARGSTCLLVGSNGTPNSPSLPQRRILFRPPRVAADPTSDLGPSIGPGAARRDHVCHEVRPDQEGAATPWAVQSQPPHENLLVGRAVSCVHTTTLDASVSDSTFDPDRTCQGECGTARPSPPAVRRVAIYLVPLARPWISLADLVARRAARHKSRLEGTPLPRALSARTKLALLLDETMSPSDDARR